MNCFAIAGDIDIFSTVGKGKYTPGLGVSFEHLMTTKSQQSKRLKLCLPMGAFGMG